MTVNLSEVASVAIYPAIGIARVGNSPDAYFIGPTIVGLPAQDEDDFRDCEGRIKRQGARFYIFAKDKDGKILGELNEEDGVTIDWEVQVANKKAAWYDFDIALDIPAAEGVYNSDGELVAPEQRVPVKSQLRNKKDFQGAERKKLMIEPSTLTITGTNTNKDGSKYHFDDGTISGTSNGTVNEIKVDLGELRTDEKGRLIFLGGLGKSASFNKTDLKTFANNDGWYDDTSDGPIEAKVTLPDGCVLNTHDTNGGAWVATAPTNFAVGIRPSTTGYSLLLNVATKQYPSLKPQTPEFYQDIYPILLSLTLDQWVNAGILLLFGWGSAYNFDYVQVLERSKDSSRANLPFRQVVFESFRDPDYAKMEADAWPPLYGDAVTLNTQSEDPREFGAITELQYENLQHWAEGNFTVGIAPTVKNWDSMTPEEQANGLTQSALEATLGGPFHPGCEFTWPMRQSMMYNDDKSNLFRIKHRKDQKEFFGPELTSKIALEKGGPLDGSNAGDITKWMAVPWQSDTSSCLSAYVQICGEYLPTFWPARVPNDVLTEEDFNTIKNTDIELEKRITALGQSSRKKWLRGFIYDDDGKKIEEPMNGVKKFVENWGKVGILVEKELNLNSTIFPGQVWVETGRQVVEIDSEEICSDHPGWMKDNPRKLR